MHTWWINGIAKADNSLRTFDANIDQDVTVGTSLAGIEEKI